MEQRESLREWLANFFKDWQILLVLLFTGLATTLFSAALAPQPIGQTLTGAGPWWEGFLQNFSTEMYGALITYALIEVIIGTKEKQRDREFQRDITEELREQIEAFQAMMARDTRQQINRFIEQQQYAARQRDEEEERQALVDQLSSRVPGFAAEAVRLLKLRGWLRETDLVHALRTGGVLSLANLEGVQLANAELNRAQMQEALLQDANFEQSRLAGVNFQGANLEGATLKGAGLVFANLKQANLRYADLRDARLFEADLTGCTLDEANLSKINQSYEKMPDWWTTSLATLATGPATFTGARLKRANLEGAVLFRADMSGTMLEDANMRGINLSIGTLQGAWLASADLTGAILNQADLSSINPIGGSLRAQMVLRRKPTILTGASLIEANLRSANLEGAEMEGVDLRDADLRGANLRNAAQLRSEQLARAKSLEGVTLPDGTKLPAREAAGDPEPDWRGAFQEWRATVEEDIDGFITRPVTRPDLPTWVDDILYEEKDDDEE